MSDIVSTPIKFLNATVLSFNTALGLGSSESTLNVDLIEDCEADPPDQFMPVHNQIEVGAPVYFSTENIPGSGFNFGGVLTNWTVSQSNSGKTYNAKVSDPRQLLENTIIIIDTFLGSPIQSINYFNVYAAYENDILSGNCEPFGSSFSTERGMPYVKIISKLMQMNPTICSPTGYNFYVNFSSFPLNVPEYYSVPGPSITILQLLQDVCDVLGLDFYVNLLPGNIISIGLIDLSIPPGSFNALISSYDGLATDINYGEELRNEKTKTLIFGEKQHYLSYVDKFEFFFGTRDQNPNSVIVPFFTDENGFWISVDIPTLNASLFSPFPDNGPYYISEMDIRAAMSSFENWQLRVFDQNRFPNPRPANDRIFNVFIRNNFNDCEVLVQGALQQLINNQNINANARNRRIADLFNDPRLGGANALKPLNLQDLEKIHEFVANLGNTYYGKQWISTLNEIVCYRHGENFQEKIFSSVPTNEGGWVDGTFQVLGLSEPELSFFRSDDRRINCFAVFNTEGIGGGGGPAGEPPPPPDDGGGTIGQQDTSSYIPGPEGY